MLNKLLPWLILISGLIYIFFVPSEPFLVSIAMKILPMILIIFYAYNNLSVKQGRFPWIIVIGLFFCMIGDATLRWFVFGLSMFLIGHIFYSSAFLTKWKFSWSRFLAIIPIGVYSFFIGSQIIEALNEKGESGLVIPVAIYIFVISFMLFTAVMTGFKSAIIGSTLFVISDSVLAWNKFVNPVVFSHEIIMITYYTAQFFIATVIIESRKWNRTTPNL